MLTERYWHNTYTYWLSERFKVSSFYTDMSFPKPCTYFYCLTKTMTSSVNWLLHGPVPNKHSKCSKYSRSHDGAAEDTRYFGIWHRVPGYSRLPTFSTNTVPYKRIESNTQWRGVIFHTPSPKKEKLSSPETYYWTGTANSKFLHLLHKVAVPIQMRPVSPSKEGLSEIYMHDCSYLSTLSIFHRTPKLSFRLIIFNNHYLHTG